MTTIVRLANRIFVSFILVAASTVALFSCWLFDKPMKPGDQFPGGEWYAEHDYELGNRTVKGVLDDSLITWDEPYMNEFSISLFRVYDDGTQEDLLASVRDENGFLRFVCHEEDNSFVISGLPSWEQTTDSYVIGEIVNYGGSRDGEVEGFHVEQYFRPAEVAQQTTLDIGTYRLKPIDTSYSLTFDLKYMYQGAEAQYEEKTYEELTALGVELSGDDTTWAGATGHESGNYARIILNVTDAHVQAGEIVFSNSLAGGIYDVGANILRDGEYAGFGYGETNATVEIGQNNPSPVYEGLIYID